MGLINSIVRFLIREHRRKPFRGDALVLGRQHLFTTYEGALELFAQEGVQPQPLPAAAQHAPNLPANAQLSSDYLSDEALFTMLGLHSLRALDFSDYEGADLIHDLNRPIPDSLRNRFDLIIDAGTTEHVFDVRQALTNYSDMLRVGGRIFHSSPANNQLGHGFYQLSPGLYFDYYGSNAFDDLRAFIVAHDARTHFTQPIDFYEFRAEDLHPEMMTSTTQLSVTFFAEKTDGSTSERIPIQGCYRKLARIDAPVAPAPPVMRRARGSALASAVKLAMPSSIKDMLRPRWMQLRARVGRDLSRRPWGLKLWSRI